MRRQNNDPLADIDAGIVPSSLYNAHDDGVLVTSVGSLVKISFDKKNCEHSNYAVTRVLRNEFDHF